MPERALRCFWSGASAAQVVAIYSASIGGLNPSAFETSVATMVFVIERIVFLHWMPILAPRWSHPYISTPCCAWPGRPCFTRLGLLQRSPNESLQISSNSLDDIGVGSLLSAIVGISKAPVAVIKTGGLMTKRVMFT